ncbi:hypothetical protein HDV00_007651 [Rhizophlyctis rosea]|nr:hypothetical protein HDV00_007651 [Rhizophlyctis rosea]
MADKSSKPAQFTSIPVPGLKDFAAGGLAGMAQVAVGHPLDTIKVRLQLEGPTARFKGGHADKACPLDCAIQTVRHEGVLGLYKGMAAPIAGIAFVNAVLFSAYGWLRNVLDPVHGANPALMSLDRIALAGAGAGAINSFVAGPIELLKIKLQAQYDHSKPATLPATDGTSQPIKRTSVGPWELGKRLVREHGWKHGIFRGTWATVVREVPAYAGFYAGFEWAKRVLAGPPAIATPSHSPSDSAPSAPAPLPVSKLMVAGAFAGVCYWTASYPLDVAKSRIQNISPEKASGSVIEALKAIHRESGVKGLFKGYTTSVVRSLPAAAATFTVYELTMRALA